MTPNKSNLFSDFVGFTHYYESRYMLRNVFLYQFFVLLVEDKLLFPLRTYVIDGFVLILDSPMYPPYWFWMINVKKVYSNTKLLLFGVPEYNITKAIH